MVFRVYTPPLEPEVGIRGRKRVFIGGSIEMGRAEDWQTPLIDALSRHPYAARLDVLNPRRPDWDPLWPNDYNFPPFRAQVDWELKWQKKAHLLVYYFAKATISPITLLELGLFRHKKPVVYCDPGYSRAGNLHVTRDHFPMDFHTDLKSFSDAVNNRITQAFQRKPKTPRLSV